MLTIKQSMELAGRNLLHCLRPEDQFRPLWGVDIEPDLRAKCRRSRFEHNVGRWWDAVLRLEAATGFEIPAEMEAAHVAQSERLPRQSVVRLCAGGSRGKLLRRSHAAGDPAGPLSSGALAQQRLGEGSRPSHDPSARSFLSGKRGMESRPDEPRSLRNKEDTSMRRQISVATSGSSRRARTAA